MNPKTRPPTQILKGNPNKDLKKIIKKLKVDAMWNLHAVDVSIEGEAVVQKFLYDNTIEFRKKWFTRANSDQLWNFFGKRIVENMAADLLPKKNKSDKTNRENASKKKAESATVMEVNSDEDESDDTDDTQEKEESD